jgi:hypothetical protein
MPFNDVAIHDGSVASLERWRYLVLNFDRGQVLGIYFLDRKTVALQVRAPITTTTSSRRFIEGNEWAIRGAASACR